MKVLIVTQQRIPHSGGLSTHVEILLAELKSGGHEVRLIQGGMAHSPKWKKAIRLLLAFGSKNKFVSSNFKHTLNRISHLVAREIEQFKPDVIHTHDVYASYSVLKSRNLRSIPVIQTVHGPALYEAQMGGADKLPAYKELIMNCEAVAFAKAKHFIAVDSGQAAILTNDYGLDSRKIDVMFNCVNVSEVRDFINEPIDLPVKQPFFLVPRRLVEKTGVRYAIEALAQLKDSHCQLVIAGQGPLRKDLEELAARLNIASRVIFLGPVPRNSLLPLFAKAKAVIVPSVPASGVVEATSLAVTEAMAAGTVPVASDIGGLAELIEHKHTGLLVKPANATELAFAMDILLQDDKFRDQLIKNATQKVEEDYSSESWSKKVVGIYQTYAK
ncbi:glycosyltransferase family 4 protein [Chitinophaga arvensicola]|uniref:Glycosyltransferase involved in cell wall bisynthesis n=1 Tax=Chitinophaga arvensicola TaxID=29529 RepID=A0A1I0S8Q2_9BACT|nr:glycosyltransferase family 4 protein [Chitinophaga arvensicola]SEW52479.1 Glycosyltransferase involved in cell wall bisynthesis [Chitinophaga arvensicola]